MHGMICKSLEAFLSTTHGPLVWKQVRQAAELPFDRFETMLSYPDAQFDAAQGAAAAHLNQDRIHLMEDIGTWICTHPPLEPVRRLFRFTGTTFQDLLLSIDEIDARGRMAVPDLGLPNYHLNQLTSSAYEVSSNWCVPGASGLLTGALRALADEYGALAMLDVGPAVRLDEGWSETVTIQLVQEAFYPVEAFSLGGAI